MNIVEFAVLIRGMYEKLNSNDWDENVVNCEISEGENFTKFTVETNKNKYEDITPKVTKECYIKMNEITDSFKNGDTSKAIEIFNEVVNSEDKFRK